MKSRSFRGTTIRVWPYLLIPTLAGLVAFPTWSTLSLTELDYHQRLALTALCFTLVGALTTWYVRWCLSRNCMAME